MSRPLSSAASTLRPSVFATLAERLKQLPPDHLPLHIGDTYRVPPEAALLDRIPWSEHPSLYKYSHPVGIAEFLETVTAKVREKNGIPAEKDSLQVTCGATQALSAACVTLLDPGDEVLVLAPFWPLILGIIRTAGGVPVQVRFSDLLLDDPGRDLDELLTPFLTPRTRALYFSNPNNPDGMIYTRSQLESLAEFCRRHDLWVLSDEAYEDYRYDGHEHLSMASLEGMFERTVSVFTFSKSYAMAGNRIGYAVAPPEVSPTLRRVSNHVIYNLSAAVQISAVRAMQHGSDFLRQSREVYQEARDVLYEPVAHRCHRPHGGGYLFLRFDSEEASWDFIHRGLDRGMASAPGEAFGQEYKHCVRVCFTAAPLEGIRRAAAILAELQDAPSVSR